MPPACRQGVVLPGSMARAATPPAMTTPDPATAPAHPAGRARPARRGARRGDRGPGPDDLRLAGRGRQPGLRAAARPGAARPRAPAPRAGRGRAARGWTPAPTARARSCGSPIAPERLEAIPWARELHRLPGARSTAAQPVTEAPATPAGRPRRARRRPAAAASPRGRGDPDAARAVRSRRRSRRLLKAEIAPADRRVQDPRRVPRHRLAAGRASARAGVDHLLVGQPRPGRGPRGAAPRGAGRRRHALRRAARSSAQRVEADGAEIVMVGTASDERQARRRAAGRGARACRSSRRTTTTGSSPARARSGWRSPRTCRISPPCSSRSVVAGWRAASRSRSGRSGPAPGSSASSRSSPPTPASR